MTLPAHQLYIASPASLRRFARWLGLSVEDVADSKLVGDVVLELRERDRVAMGIPLGPRESLRDRYDRRRLGSTCNRSTKDVSNAR